MLLSRTWASGWQKINTFANMSNIIAGDKKGNGVKVGDTVKVSHRKMLYRIYEIHLAHDGNPSESYPIFELEPCQPETIFRDKHQIELFV